jgi:2-keto-4-pentenoate hydratase/2-oxohepta-3-ene-1,7-dioic acid hydratase in catechol pathway
MPSKFFAIGLNFADHSVETGLARPDFATVIPKATTSVSGPFDPIIRPVASEQLDYEGELGIVIGTRCRQVSREQAPSVIAGYLIVNDVSVRDWQMRTTQWSMGKSFDTHGPIGPWITTPEEIGDPHSLELRTFVNGELRQQASTADLIFDCFDIVEQLSATCTLEPGDVIATGTPAGVALGDNNDYGWLQPGDIVRVEIDGLGAIENQVVPEDRPA